jgi:uncharacterized protein involved in response to NO
VTTSDKQRVEHDLPPVWSLAFRPFFLAASLWSVVALTFWTALFAAGVTLPSRFDPLNWHIHEMLFGFVFAAIAGFMLTAIPNWTGRVPIRGTPLAGLLVLWLLGRVVSFTSAWMPLWVAASIDMAFPLALGIVAAREIVLARNWRNLMMPLPIGFLGIADLLMYLELAGFDVPAGMGWRLGLASIIILISVIGGRLIPAFTRNWLLKRNATSLPAEWRSLDRVALASLHGGLIGWALFPDFRWLGVLLLVAGVLNFGRVVRWRGFATLGEPLLAILHLGYLWIALGAVLLGAAMLSPRVPEAAAIHALTAGAIGTMVLAVMTRVARGHTGRPLEADALTSLIYVAIVASAAVRVAAAFADTWSMMLLVGAAALWVASFALFVVSYGPWLVLPRADARRRT